MEFLVRYIPLEVDYVNNEMDCGALRVMNLKLAD